MANNFKLVGDIHVSKEGNDTTGDGSADNPFASIQSGIDACVSGQSLVIGAGMYNEAPLFNKALFIYGDGYVLIFKESGDTTLGNINNTALCEIYGINFFGFEGSSSINFSANIATIFYDCVIKNNNLGIGFARPEFVRSILVNVTSTYSSFGTKYYNSIFLNSSLNFGLILNSFIDESSLMHANANPSASNFSNNSISGSIDINGNLYSLYKDKAGNTIVPANNHTDLETVMADVYTTRACFNQDPEFGNISKGDYRYVADTSPLLQAASDGSNIANVYKGVQRTMADTDLNPGQVTEDVAVSASGDWVYSGSVGLGRVITKAIQVSAADDEILNFLNFGAAFNFNSDSPKGSADNLNVLSRINYTDNGPGENPRRLTYEMRWSTQTVKPNEDPTVANGSGWDNNGNRTEGAFVTFEVNTQPLIDHTGKGNGNPDFNKNTAGNLIAKWVQLRITIQEGLG